MNHALDPFQHALLEDLRAVAGDGDLAPDSVSPLLSTGARAHRPRRFLAAAAVIALVGVGITAASVIRSEPAYAVNGGEGGAVDVRVNRLEDAAGVEVALGRAGVRADVRYLPDATQCADGRYRPAVVPDPTADFTFSFGGDGYAVRLEPGVISNTQTLVIWATRTPGGVAGSVGVAAGPVGPCVQQPFDDGAGAS